jgi:hypothetical protein
MKHEAEFKEFLTTKKRSVRTGNFYSTKVVSDMVRRCKATEHSLNIELSPETMRDAAFVLEICKKIRAMKLTSTDGNPNNHNSLVHAVKVYCEFLSAQG